MKHLIGSAPFDFVGFRSLPLAMNRRSSINKLTKFLPVENSDQKEAATLQGHSRGKDFGV